MKRVLLAGLLAGGILGAAASADAADFSFTGNFTHDNDVAYFSFNVGADSVVTLRTYSYAGGVNSAGQTIARGGFDPILSLYDSSGARLAQNDDGGPSYVPVDAVSGQAWDTFLTQFVTVGSYRVAVSQYNNFGPVSIPGAFPHDGDPNFRNGFTDVSGAANNPRDGHWAFDVLNVGTASHDPVPEPAAWALMITGFGMAGSLIRRRRPMATEA